MSGHVVDGGPGILVDSHADIDTFGADYIPALQSTTQHAEVAMKYTKTVCMHDCQRAFQAISCG